MVNIKTAETSLGSINVEDGKIIYTVDNPGTEEWNVKLTLISLTQNTRIGTNMPTS